MMTEEEMIVAHGLSRAKSKQKQANDNPASEQAKIGWAHLAEWRS